MSLIRRALSSSLLRRQDRSQCSASSSQPRLHRTKIHLENLGNLFIGEPVNLPQDDYCAEDLRHLPQCGFYVRAQLLARSLIKWRHTAISQRRAEWLRIALRLGVAKGTAGRVHRDLLPAVPLPPAPLVAGLM